VGGEDGGIPLYCVYDSFYCWIFPDNTEDVFVVYFRGQSIDGSVFSVSV
jgi:hypothetical protein